MMHPFLGQHILNETVTQYHFLPQSDFGKWMDLILHGYVKDYLHFVSFSLWN